jgi:hypothetical protein
MKGRPLLVPRTCLRHTSSQEGEAEPPLALVETRKFPAYVLLGDPGSGKTQAFEQEANANGGRRISAGDFIALDYPELQDADMPVFIDGLDESRAGTKDGRVPLDEIRKKLQQLRCKCWRISCRAADWLGATDVNRLQAILPPGTTVEAFTLQPLTLEDVVNILPANHGIPDPQAFIDTARQHRLADLLFNPQTLEMLAKAVGAVNRWPEARQDVYDLACKRLAQEHNTEHLAAARKDAPDQVRLRRAAAFLCTIHLLADVAGFTRGPNPSARVLTLNAIPNPDKLPLDEALSSRLFNEAGRDVFAPVHRTVAEFLAAEYLTEGLKDTLSLRRVLAQICGADGGIVSGMRGLGAWLSSISTDARPTLTRLDPLGLLLYGDATRFTVAEKMAVLDGLGEAIAFSPSFRWHDWDGRPFPALVAPDMQTVVNERLVSADRSDENQIVAVTLLEGLRLAPAEPALAPVLLAVAREATRWGSVRLRALKVYLRWVGPNDPGLRTLLDDIAAGVVPDADDEILGAMLTAMYPKALPSSELPRFLHPPKQQNLIGRYTMFWRHDLANATELPHLLDAFAQRPELRRANDTRETRDYARAIGSVLARALEEVGDQIPDDRLLTWLDACCGEHARSLLEHDDAQAVRRWLEARPQRYFALLDLALDRYWTEQGRAWSAKDRLHGAREPLTAPAWWLEKAEVATDETRAKEYFELAVRSVPHEPGPEIDALLTEWERAAKLRGWQNWLTAMLTCDLEQSAWRLEDAGRKNARAQEAAARRSWFRERLATFDLPKVPEDMLGTVVNAYEHRFVDIDGDTPGQRLENLFDGDREVVEAAIRMLRNACLREDLPSLQQILNDAAANTIAHLTAAMQIGLALRYRDEPRFLDSLSDERLTAALTAHLAYTREDDEAWVDAAVRARPKCMADALGAYVAAALRWKKRSPDGTFLFRRLEYRDVARRCLLPLLEQFPTRSRPNQRGALSDMLHAALNLPARDELLAIVKDRVAAPKMDGPQRAAWLATGLLLDADQYLPLVTCYLRKSRRRTDGVAGFLHHHRETGDTENAPSSEVLGVLIEHFAHHADPVRQIGAFRVTSAMDRAEQVRRFITELAGRADADSTAQLRRLEPLPTLAAWAPLLREARAGQEIVRRDATFERPSWQQVCAMLQQGRPSTATEIAAVVNDTIADLKDQIRHSDLNLYLAYWNTDGHKKPKDPRHEEVCRDMFGDQLRVRLARFGIECLPEAQHVDEKRSDLWCTIERQGVPIEIKRDRHPELWRAVTGQLLARYTNDPRAKGYGIYVVLWFGEPGKMPAPPSDQRPSTAEELQAMLKAGLSEEQRRTIAVHVVDCSVRKKK